MADQQFEGVMRGRSDAELLLITTRDRGDYVLEALLAAEAELARRNLSAEGKAAAEVGMAVMLEDRAQQAERLDVWRQRFWGLWRLLNPLEQRGLELQAAVFTLGVVIWWAMRLWADWGGMATMFGFFGVLDPVVLTYWWIALAVPLGLWCFRGARALVAREAGWVLLAVLLSQQGGMSGSMLVANLRFQVEFAPPPVEAVPVVRGDIPLGLGPGWEQPESFSLPQFRDMPLSVEVPSLWDDLEAMAWYGLLLLFLGRGAMVAHCGVDGRTRWLALLAPCWVMLLMGFVMFFL